MHHSRRGPEVDVKHHITDFDGPPSVRILVSVEIGSDELTTQGA